MISPHHNDEWWFHSCTFKDGLGAWFPATRMLNGLILSVSFTSSCHTFEFISVLYSPLFTVHHPYHDKLLFNSWRLSFWSSLVALLSFPAWCLSYKFSAFLWAAFSFLFLFFSTFSLFSRWNFHWLKPDVACTFVFTWPSPAQEDESLAVLFYQFTRFPHPSLSPGCWLQNQMSPRLIVCRFRRQSGGELFCFCCQV